MADVKDILNISSDKTPSRVEAILGKKKTPTQKKRKKPEGLSREVFALQESALLGAGPEVTAPPPQVPVFKEKRVAEPQKVSWVWRGFKNSARTDGAIFKHWIRADDKVDDYRFARYNRKLKLESYTAAEYNSHLQNPNWTKEETDHLFDLCRRFDLRFVVIADAFEGQKPRTVEELKERFYSVSSKLVDLHKLPDEDLSTNPLHKKQEEERKQQGDRLFLRTAAQVQEEEGLIEEFRRIDTEMKKHNKAKKRIAQLMHYALTPNTTDTSNTNNNIPAPSPVSLPTPPPKHKKRKGHPNDDDDEYEPESADFDQNSTHVSTNSTPGRKGRHPNRFQSTPVTMGTKTAYRVESALVELGVLRADAPPVQAPSVTKAFNELKQELVILLDLQKYVPMREAHLEVVRQHRDALLQDLKEKGIPIPALHGHDRNALASSSTSVFGLASLEEDGEKEREETNDSFLAPPPSRSRAPRDKEHKRVHKKHKVADV